MKVWTMSLVSLMGGALESGLRRLTKREGRQAARCDQLVEAVLGREMTIEESYRLFLLTEDAEGSA